MTIMSYVKFTAIEFCDQPIAHKPAEQGIN